MEFFTEVSIVYTNGDYGNLHKVEVLDESANQYTLSFVDKYNKCVVVKIEKHSVSRVYFIK